MSGMTFRCISTDENEIPQEIMERKIELFPKVHIDSDEMAKLSKEIKNYKQDTICTVPFCSTVEAEALGGLVNLGDGRIGPRINKYVYDNIEELKNMKTIDLKKGRIKVVLDSIEKLTKEGEVVALNVAGPFMIITSLIDPMTFYKSIRKDKEAVKESLKLIEDNTIEYIKEALKRGVKIISFSDSVGAEEIVGPRVYKDLAGVASMDTLKRIKELKEFNQALVHICGKTSVSLEKHGFIRLDPLTVEEDMTYGEAIIDLIDTRENIKFIGHSCMKKTPNKLKSSKIWCIS